MWGKKDRIDRIVLREFWLSSKEIEDLIQEKNNNDFLNQYRWALSLYTEFIADTKHKVIVTLDGRDTAWKWSNIKRITEYWKESMWDTSVYWIPTADERFEHNWFDRYAIRFPEESKTTLYDRSWYNRAFVEPAMWFCTEQEYDWFMEHVNEFEKEQIIDAGIHFIKVYLSIWKETQKERLRRRDSDMRWRKSSQIDAQAQEKWNFYTLAKIKALELTDTDIASWTVVDSTEKFLSATEIIKKIILTSDEVSQLVQSRLSIDLSPNLDIVRTWLQELKRMKRTWDIWRAKSEFVFADSI